MLTISVLRLVLLIHTAWMGASADLHSFTATDDAQQIKATLLNTTQDAPCQVWDKKEAAPQAAAWLRSLASTALPENDPYLQKATRSLMRKARNRPMRFCQYTAGTSSKGPITHYALMSSEVGQILFIDSQTAE